ncbi:bifunctional H-ACA RNP complex subunit Gar1-Naf1 [Babesia duncani]|uniref:H/ACA ribonucleoprotein complex subunit n=1 Tax=Babesia duncani TaxID=323732 RepID=A0AAD9PLA5_9APIC|nr:bifunctional H-ACA RNP complex subunit Gar1-Naf1 [Babesia duncani]
MNPEMQIVIDGETEIDDLQLVRHIAQVESEQIRHFGEPNRKWASDLATTRKIDLVADSSDEDAEVSDYGLGSNSVGNSASFANPSGRANLLDNFRLIDTVDLPESVPGEFAIANIGVCCSIVDLFVIVKSTNLSCTLDLGSIVCKADRTIIGTISDTFGQTRDPFYLVVQKSPGIAQVGEEIYYDVGHSTLVTDAHIASDVSSVVEDSDGEDCEMDEIKAQKLPPRLRQTYGDLSGNPEPTTIQGNRGPLANIAKFTTK